MPLSRLPSAVRTRVSPFLPLALLLGFFLTRGLNLAAVQLPFNGWDEFAHMAVAYYVHEHGHMPSPEEATPEALREFVQAHAHPWLSYIQLRPWNATLYPGGVCASDLPVPDTNSLARLYQAQHGMLYYHFAALFLTGPEPAAMLRWADTMRIFAVLCGAGVLATWWFLLRRLFPSAAGRWTTDAALFLTAGYGFFGHNVTRVANDPLAMLLGSLALAGHVFLLKDRPPDRMRLLLALLVGMCAGLAVLAKATALPVAVVLGAGCLLPALPRPAWLPRLALPSRAAGGGASPGRHSAVHALATAAILTGGYLLVAGWYHLDCLREYGSLTMMQEAVLNARNGKTFLDLLRALPEVPLTGMTNFPFYYSMAYLGGWSGFATPVWLDRGFELGLYGCGAGLLGALCLARTRRELAALLGRGWEAPSLLLLTWAALLFHVLHSFVAWGTPTTGAWYGMLAMPALFFCLLIGPRLVLPAGAGWAACLLLLCFTVGVGMGAYYELVQCQTGLVNTYNALYILTRHHDLLSWDLHRTLAVEMALAAGALFRLAREAGDAQAR